MLTDSFMSYKEERMLNIPYPKWSLLFLPNNHTKSPQHCQRIINPFVSYRRKLSCFAMILSPSIDNALNLFRYDQIIERKKIEISSNRRRRRRKLEEEGEPLEEVVEEVTIEEEKAVEGGKEEKEIVEIDQEKEELEKRRQHRKNKPKNKPQGQSSSSSSPSYKWVTTVHNLTGFFGSVANENGRNLFQKKALPLLSGLSSLETHISSTLQQHSLLPGRDSLVVMVLNPGELDIFANLICSCNKYNLSTHNFLVFTTQEEILPLITAHGVIGIFHSESFAFARIAANYEYLDKTFIDMMWYKSFSIWILLKLGYNILFQDIDIVWFRNPFPYFEKLVNGYRRSRGYALTSSLSSSSSSSTPHQQQALFLPDIILSDDGQRSLRYAPWYANSGFYYLFSNEKMIHFAWEILMAFPILHISGSHQNIFTLKLLEGLDAYQPTLNTLFLPMHDFPSGVKFSHDRPYMHRIKVGLEEPYIFHM
jgi:hypothetical protein